MAKPTWVAMLAVQLDDDTIEGFTGVGYYAHRFGLDVVNETGDYVRRFSKEEYLTYHAARPAAMHAA